MFGWRRRNDGFEWREYVRTTILVRRKNRRERLGRAGQAAAQGLKVAGQRGAAAGAQGALVLGRGVKAAGQQGAAVGVAGAQAAGAKLRAGLPKLWAVIRALAGKLLAGLVALAAGLRAAAVRSGQVLAPVLAAGLQRLDPVFATLRQPEISVPLAVVGAVALLGSGARIATKGVDRDVFIAFLIGSAILGILAAARLGSDSFARFGFPFRQAGDGLARLAERIGPIGSIHPAVFRVGAIAVGLAVVAGGGWLLWRAAPALPGLPSLGASQIKGRGYAVSGDTLRVGSNTVRLAGIEAPEKGQTCISTRSGRWECGAEARSALSRILGRGRVTCEVSGSDDQGQARGKCSVAGKDVGADLVRGGHVFSTAGIFSSYRSLEGEAKTAKLGLWRGDAERPSDYRAQRWEEAKREAPDGCPIKGNVTGGRRVYLLPWSQGYSRAKVSATKGERWFCSEADAKAAGWVPLEQS